MKKNLYSERDLRLECLKQAVQVFIIKNGPSGYTKELVIDLAKVFFNFVSEESLGIDE